MASPVKTKWFRFYVAHEVLVGNTVAMLLGDWMTNLLFVDRFTSPPAHVQSAIEILDISYALVCALVLSALIIWYEIPIRQCLKAISAGGRPEPATLETARRRVINEPYLICMADAMAWLLGTVLFWLMGSTTGFLVNIGSGLLTVTLAFFWLEHSFQHTRIPIFFPGGDLSAVKGARSMNLRGRILALVFAASLVPLSFILITVSRFRQMRIMDEMPLLSLVLHLEMTIVLESLVFMGIAVLLSLLVVHHLTKPLKELIQTMDHMKKGGFSQKAQVYTNDEIGLAAEALNAMGTGLQEREFIKDTFGKYVDRQIRDEILLGRVSLDGERKEATILFSDLRNFTPLVAVTPPKELIFMLNAYLDEMARAIDGNGGLILQFIGDEIEAVFGAPVAMEGHERAAVEAALEMRQRLARLNREFESKGLPALSHGIGIHTGPVLAARIGSADRSAYSLIGDTVNTASRIQELNKNFSTDILVSEQMHRLLRNRYDLTPMPGIRVQGKTSPVHTFTVNIPLT